MGRNGTLTSAREVRIINFRSGHTNRKSAAKQR